MAEGTRELKRGFEQYQRRVYAAAVALARRTGASMEGDAKVKAPWTDRTGHARQSLFGDERHDENAIISFVAHGVEYGVRLEHDYHGRYSILKPTRDRHAESFKRDVKKILSRAQ